jgi:hypothetical protein
MSEDRNILKGLNRISQWSKIHSEQTSYSILGINSRELDRYFQGFPFKIPKELYQLYEHGYTCISNGPEPCSFLKIQTSIDHCLGLWMVERIPRDALKAIGKNYLPFYEGCFEDEEYMKVLDQYPIDWVEFPISYGFGKENYIVRCYKTETEYSPVWVRFMGESPVMYASSLTNLILTMAECYETGAYSSVFIEEDNYYDIVQDTAQIEKIFQKYNPEQMDTWRSIWED